MNLRVDLILETEQRSASVINAKSLTRIGVIVGPAILGLIVAAAVVDHLTLNSRLNTVREQLADEEPRLNDAGLVEKELKGNNEILTEVTGWSKSRMELAPILEDVQKLVPPEIQLVDLTINQSCFVTNSAGGKVLARAYRMVLRGKALSDDAKKTEDLVLKLRKDLATAPSLAKNVDDKDVVVSNFGASPDVDAPKNLRLFDITCGLKARKFE
jgi:hypothetical protein